ncbi:MAG: sigma-70 family RNA polymerase sigma factor [Bacteroidota bacterium]
MSKSDSNITETELILALKARDEKALSILYDRYSAALYGIVFKIVKEKELAEDVMQEAFVKMWNNFRDYDDTKGRLFTWILNVARNLAIDKTRSKSFKNSFLEVSSDEREVFHSKEMSTQQPEYIGMKDLLIHLREEEKLLVELIYFQGYTRTEVADELGIPLGTVKTRIRSAIIKLRKFFNTNESLQD